ncbi:hypothetical protein [Sporolactobacillus pectinivorans]|uniref:hypothetical protein n=1 Tax=Sporolactobacillus pectinivorans TaxID=1591408 RepID=UPI000C260CF3|nr:hypothetical protein [Sporolactobacillus pectinivorans]
MRKHWAVVISIPRTINFELGSTAALSLPSVIGRNGIERRPAIPLDDEEVFKFKGSYESIHATMIKGGLVQ